MAKAVPMALTPSLSQMLLDRIGRRIRFGTLSVELPDGSALRYAGREGPGPQAHWRLHNYRPLRALLTHGATGFGEAYVDGDWDTDSLVDLLHFAALNDQSIGRAGDGLGVARFAARLRHRLRANSRRQARRNIAHHYDLGNTFYAAWLDSTMTYSAALFERDDEPLDVAQRRKYARMADLAGIATGNRVLEIGCGWGGFMDFAADAFDCDVTGVSISREQCRYAQALLAQRDYRNSARVEFRDYRDLAGTYDCIVSIEMFEAVGEAYWDTYAHALKRLLAPGGAAALQVITIDESRFERYRSTPDFIQTHVFPGGMLPTRGALADTFRRAGLAVTREFTAGEDYARTLAVWRERFDEAWPALRADGFDEPFRRLWHFYLAYCEAGFRTGATNVVQVRLEHA